MKNNSEKSSLPKIILTLLLALPLMFAFFFLKGLVAKPEAEQHPISPKTMSARPIEKWQQEVSADTLAETIDYLQSDTLVLDHRAPIDAGDEDGFWDGWNDGAEAGLASSQQAAYRRSYDASSNFPTPEERDAYAVAYAAAYELGFAEAKQCHESSLKH